jgi:hypothetical protein
MSLLGIPPNPPGGSPRGGPVGGPVGGLVGGPVGGLLGANNHGIPGIIGGAASMQHVFRITRRVAATNASVLILGETGVGKELIAAAGRWSKSTVAR